MPPQSNRLREVLMAGAVAALLAAAVWLRPSQHTVRQPIDPLPAVGTSPATSPAPLPARPPGEIPSPLPEVYGRIRAASDARSAQIQLIELQSMLSRQSTNVAVAEIRRFLDSGADAPTHLGFKVGNNGLLDEAPTLRTHLLEALARLDPVAAAEYAHVILSRMDSPDEWALALRNLARGDASAEGRALLREKTAEMLAATPWRQGATTGFLEAFDVAVYLGGTDLLPTLTEMVRQPVNPATAHASYLALDRLVINDPASTLAALLEAPDSMQGREQTRGNFFARADVRDSQQRKILESYLANPALSPAELDAFAGTFPNANCMISANLLTQNRTIHRTTLVDRDRESLRVVREWLANPEFADRRATLEKLEQRLDGFVESAKQGR